MYDFYLEIQDSFKADKIAGQIQAGNRFLFAEDKQFLQARGKKPNRKMQRLQINQNSADRHPGVRAIIPGSAVQLSGMRVSCQDAEPGLFGAIIPDRDLYKAEQDTINLLLILPMVQQHKEISLVVYCHGEEFCTIDVRKALAEGNGLALESLSMLLPGQYTARLLIDDNLQDEGARFTVAEYQLAPLDATLSSHSMNKRDVLSFELDVTSYGIPWQSALEVQLIEEGLALDTSILKAKSPGRYGGKFSLTGHGPYRLRIMDKEDASRLCEVALTGSSYSERTPTVISELGAECQFSLLPMPQAIPVRGGFLQQQARKMGIELNNCITNHPCLHIHRDVETLSLLVWNLLENTWSEYHVDNLKPGDDYAIPKTSNMMMVFVGAWIGGQPFEAFTTVLSSDGQQIDLSCQEKLLPGELLDLEIQLQRATKYPLPVYINIRDSRLTSSSKPAVALGECLKQHIEYMTEDYDDYELEPLNQRDDYHAYRVRRKFSMDKVYSAVAAPVLQESGYEEIDLLGACEFDDAKEIKSPDEDGARGDFPDSVYCGLVYVQDQTNLQIRLTDGLGRFAIDAFVYDDGDWVAADHSFLVDMPVRADLDFPPVVHNGDEVYGRLRAQSESGKAQLYLSRDGNAVDLGVQMVKTPFEMDVALHAGEYQLTVIDEVSGERDSIKMTVAVPGQAKSINNGITILQAGETFNLDSAPGIVSLSLLPGFEQSTENLLKTTASYSHLCCEQTAAKILAACAMYIMATDAKTRQEAEKIILAGVAREKSMITKQGFKMYPDSDYHSEYYSKLAVQYLWQLASLQQATGLSSSLQRAIEQGLAYADMAAKHHKMQRVTDTPQTLAEAWMLACEQANHPAIERLINQIINWQGMPELKQESDPVFKRTTMAYAAACLLKQNDINRALKLANVVMQDLNESGALYSTVDSVALIALMSMLKTHALMQDRPKLKVNGQIMDEKQIQNLAIESIEVLEGIAILQVQRIVQHNWLQTSDSMKVKVKLLDKGKLNMGDRVDLSIKLEQGYVNGDLVHVGLPGALSWIQGGGKIKEFSMDFAGQEELIVPLLVTSKIPGEQHFCVLVRNMFEENRIACPGLIQI